MEKIIIEKGASNEIYNEFKKISFDSIKSWLITKNIVTDTDNLILYKDLYPWRRGGGETYITQFELSFISKGVKDKKSIIIKAIITTPVEQSLANWKNRRAILARNNIKVSNWYWFGNGIIIEDYYPKDYTYCELTKLIDIANVLDKLGFKTLNFLNDIRCDEANEPYYIDFGFDLGDPSVSFSRPSLANVMKMFPEKLKFIEEYT